MPLYLIIDRTSDSCDLWLLRETLKMGFPLFLTWSCCLLHLTFDWQVFDSVTGTTLNGTGWFISSTISTVLSILSRLSDAQDKILWSGIITLEIVWDASSCCFIEGTQYWFNDPIFFQPPCYTTSVIGFPPCNSVVAIVFLTEWSNLRPCRFPFSVMSFIIRPRLSFPIVCLLENFSVRSGNVVMDSFCFH